MLTQEHLVGREAEVAAVLELVASASGDGGGLVVRGEPGIGKSALLEIASREAARAGVRVLRVTGVPTEARLPFAALHQLLRPLLKGLDALPPPQRSALAAAFGLAEGAAQDPFLISLATLTLLTDAAAEQPILAVIDDAQWIDRPSDEVISFVARRLGSDPVALLCADRGGDAATTLESAGLPVLSIEPLDDARARELLDRRSSQLRAADRERVLDEAAGNPLALVELAAGLGTAGIAGPADPLPVTDRIERTFAGRLGDLPDTTVKLLLLIALDDRGLVDEILAAAGTLGVRNASVEMLAPAVGAGLVDLADTAVHFRHPLMRSAVAQHATDAERRAAHSALADAAGDPDRAAWHLAAAAANRPDETASALLEAAADRAEQRGAIAVAVTTLERAARLTPDDETRGRRLLRAVDLAYALGRYDMMGRLLDEAGPLGGPDQERRRDAWRLALRLNGPKSAREEHNIRAVLDAVAGVGTADADFALALLGMVALRCWWMDVPAELWRRVVELTDAIAPSPDDPRALYVHSGARDRPDELLERLGRWLDAPESLAPVAVRNLGVAATWIGDLDAATQFFSASVGALRAQGRLGLIARGQILFGWCAATIGRLSEAGPALDEGLRLAMETGQEAFVATAHWSLAMYHALRGDLERASASASEQQRHARQMASNGLLGQVHYSRGLLDLAAGRYADAFDSLRHIYDPGDEGHHAIVQSWAVPDLADAAIAAGRVGEATRYLEALEGDANVIAGPWQRINVAYARAVLAADREGDEGARDAFAAALAMDLERWPLPRARLLLAYGSWLRRQRRVAESRDPLRSARDLLDAIGVPWMADRARRELGATGEVSGAPRPKSVDDLTPQELQIAQLAAGGLSNREIAERLYLSHRTVGFHLYHVYPKLGISGRAQLHAALGAA